MLSVAELKTKRRKQTDTPDATIESHWPRGCSGVTAVESIQVLLAPHSIAALGFRRNGRIKGISSEKMVGREVLLEVWRPHLQATFKVRLHDDYDHPLESHS